jgi:hypothetical protein
MKETKENIRILIKFIYDHAFKLDCKEDYFLVLKAADILKDDLDEGYFDDIKI